MTQLPWKSKKYFFKNTIVPFLHDFLFWYMYDFFITFNICNGKNSCGSIFSLKDRYVIAYNGDRHQWKTSRQHSTCLYSFVFFSQLCQTCKNWHFYAHFYIWGHGLVLSKLLWCSGMASWVSSNGLSFLSLPFLWYPFDRYVSYFGEENSIK